MKEQALTFTEEQIREACKRLPFSFTDEEIVLVEGVRRGSVCGQFRMRQAVDFSISRSKSQRAVLAQMNLREFLSRHMAALLLAVLKGDAETLAQYSEDREVG